MTLFDSGSVLVGIDTDGGLFYVDSVKNAAYWFDDTPTNRRTALELAKISTNKYMR